MQRWTQCDKWLKNKVSTVIFYSTQKGDPQFVSPFKKFSFQIIWFHHSILCKRWAGSYPQMSLLLTFCLLSLRRGSFRCCGHVLKELPLIKHESWKIRTISAETWWNTMIMITNVQWLPVNRFHFEFARCPPENPSFASSPFWISSAGTCWKNCLL